MAYSYVLLPGDGTTTSFSIPFQYLDQSHVGVKVNGEVTAFSWLTGSTISIVPTPLAATIIEIRRTTPKNEPPVNFTDGSTLLEADLDLLSLYQLYLAQEVDDGVKQSITQNAIGVWDGQGRRATNFGDPKDKTDLVTKGYFDDTYGSGIASQLAAAQAAALLAQNYKNAAAVSEQNAAKSEYDAADILDSFKKQYQGSTPTDPATRYDGSPLQTGDLAFNTTLKAMRVFNGDFWEAAVSSVKGVRAVFRFIATAGQTMFSGPDVNGDVLAYDPEYANLYLNGIRLDPTDYSAITGTSVTLSVGANPGDELNIEAFGTFNLADFSGASIRDKTITTEKLALSSIIDLKWLSKGIGELYVVQDHMGGSDIPPTDSPHYRFIRLTASDSYNSGCLTSQTLSGSSPNVVATAVVSLAASPIFGKTVALMNTERTFIRPGSSGTLLEDTTESHTHTASQVSHTHDAYTTTSTTPGGGLNFVNDANNRINTIFNLNYRTGAAAPAITVNATGSAETAPRSRGATLYMRIK